MIHGALGWHCAARGYYNAPLPYTLSALPQQKPLAEPLASSKPHTASCSQTGF
jgi:hypothetical protein